MQFLAQCLGCRFEHIARQMRLAALPGGALKVALDGVDEAPMGIRDDEVHPSEAAALEPAQEARPARLRFTVAEL